MKRWQLAKEQGLNWQVILIQDCETDIKVITLESVRLHEPYNVTNKKVTRLINDCIKDLESVSLKTMCRETLFKYASRVYLQWLSVFGTYAMGVSMLAVMGAKGIEPPPKAKNMLANLPKENGAPTAPSAAIESGEYDTEYNSNAPDFVYNKAVPNNTFTGFYEKDVLERVNDIMGGGAKEDYAERYSLRASAERQLRYEWHEKNLQDLRDKGVKLIWINTHANCSERCQPYQGKLYSLDGTSGTIDGKSYEPLENATDIYYTTKSGKTYKNGILSGFNCRHTTRPYTKGSKPQHIPADVIERQRDIEKKQREMERTIRKYESRYLGNKAIKDTAKTKLERVAAEKLCKHNKALIKKWTEEYKEFSKQNNVAYYPSRLKI